MSHRWRSAGVIAWTAAIWPGGAAVSRIDGGLEIAGRPVERSRRESTVISDEIALRSLRNLGRRSVNSLERRFSFLTSPSKRILRASVFGPDRCDLDDKDMLKLLNIGHFLSIR
ncbi:MAG: hypothetical protein P4L82_04890 [Ancalomicrobiaceae bacterium]|nr:hypothetical protein [Ancalomicrobiaceae bacterium]